MPCQLLKGGFSDLSIYDALLQAPEIRELADPSPLVTLALHRLLIAILHRNFGPANAAAWERMWKARAWDKAVLSKYLENSHHQFNLFDAERPFYQVATLNFRNESSITKLAHELASGNNATLFDHSNENAPPSVTAPEAARWLMAYQAFAAGGLVSRERGSAPSAHAAPLTRGAVVLVKGRNLFETLMLNLVRYDPENEEPFKSSDKDCPAWEREGVTDAQDRAPDGYLDLLTWQSRRIRLRAEAAPNGNILVRAAVIMKGFQFPSGFHLYGKETMLAFFKNQRAKGDQDPWPPLTFQEGRALWRDSTALFQSANEERSRPQNLQWLDELSLDGRLEGGLIFPLDVLGLRTDRAKVLFWRHERLPLPLEYLHNDGLIAALKLALDDAEAAARVLRDGVRRLAELIVAPFSDASDGSRANRDDVGALIITLAGERSFWPAVDSHFKRLIVSLPLDKSGLNDSSEYGDRELPRWADRVREAALQSFARARDALAPNQRSHKAIAKAEAVFYSKLKADLVLSEFERGR
jgi:CRISPR system Cascade subunit CasA